MKLSNGTIAAITVASAVFIGATGAVIFGATRNSGTPTASDDQAIYSQFDNFRIKNNADIQEGSNAYKVYNIVIKFVNNPEAGELIAIKWNDWKKETNGMPNPCFGRDDDHPAPYRGWLFAYCKDEKEINSYNIVGTSCPSFKFEERLSGLDAVAKFIELYDDKSIPEGSATPTPAPGYPALPADSTDNFSSWYNPRSILETLQNALKEAKNATTLEELVNIYTHLEVILTAQNEEFSKQFFGSNKAALLITQKPSTTSDISASAKIFIAKPTDYITTTDESTLDSVASTFATNYNDCHRKFDADHNGAHFLSYQSECTSPTTYTYAYVEGDNKAEEERKSRVSVGVKDTTYYSNDESDKEAFRRYLTERIEFGIKYLNEHPDVANALDAAIKSEDKANPTAKASTLGTATKSEDEVETPPAPATIKETVITTSTATRVEPNEQDSPKIPEDDTRKNYDDIIISDSDTEDPEGVY